MTVLLCLASLIVVPWLAVKGITYRGVYIAGSLLVGAGGWFVLGLPGVDTLTATSTSSEIVGAQFITNYGPSVGGWMIVTAFACLVAAALYRRRTSTPSPTPADSMSGERDRVITVKRGAQ